MVSIISLPESQHPCVGYYKEKRDVGRPTEHSKLKKVWVTLCNYSICVTGRVCGEVNTWDSGKRDRFAGWLMNVNMLQNEVLVKRTVYLKADECLSRGGLARAFAKSLSGAISSISPHEFHSLINNDLPEFQVISYCGKHYLNDDEFVWVYPGCTMSSNCEKLSSAPVFVTRDSLLSNGSNIPLKIRAPPCDIKYSESRAAFERVMRYVKEYYNVNFWKALQVIGFGFLSLNRREILKTEKQMHVLNISGLPNVGKTMISSIVCEMLSCDHLMMSKCSVSAINSLSSSFSDMLLVWDDPRDLSASQAETLIHEFFHGHASTTQLHGNRYFRSSLLIGTQHPNLGHNLSSATKSRMSHVHFSGKNNGSTSMNPKCFESCRDCFLALSNIPFSVCSRRSKRLYEKYVSMYPHVMTRVLKTVSLEVTAMELLCGLARMDDDHTHAAIHDHVVTGLIEYFEEHCPVEDAFESFRKLISTHKHEFDKSYFKVGVNISVDGRRARYVAFVLADVVNHLKANHSKVPTYEVVHKSMQQKARPGYLEFNRNVNFSGTVRRCIVIREEVVMQIPHAFDCGIFL
jgi:hypothetical protein